MLGGFVRNIVLALSLTVSLAGCAYRPVVVQNEPDFTPLPLTVRLLPPENRLLRFLTSEPAYVAIFEVAPDRGVSLIYPRSFEEPAPVSPAGLNLEFLPWRVEGRWYYASAPYYSAVSTFTQPTYLYMIASKSPLRVDDIQRSPATLRSAMGWRSFLATNLSATLDDIERMVVGSLPEDEWSSDLYIIWPDVPNDRPWHTQYAFVSCDDGRMVLVPLGWNIPACPGTRNLAQATKPTTPPTTPPETEPDSSSSGGPQIPGKAGGGRGRPVPRAVDALPAGSVRDRLSDYEPGRRGTGADRPDRVARAPGGDQPRREAPEPRPAPAPRQETPRPEPTPRAEPERREPRPAAPTPSEPAEPKPAGKP